MNSKYEGLIPKPMNTLSGGERQQPSSGRGSRSRWRTRARESRSGGEGELGIYGDGLAPGLARPRGGGAALLGSF